MLSSSLKITSQIFDFGMEIVKCIKSVHIYYTTDENSLIYRNLNQIKEDAKGRNELVKLKYFKFNQ